MTVFSDASALITLARIRRIASLADLFGRVRISTVVFDEVVVAGASLPGAMEVLKSEGIDVVPVGDLKMVAQLGKLNGLGMGEVSTVILTENCEGGISIIDEIKGRRFAEARGVKVIGCVGLLEVMYRHGIVRDLRDEYKALVRFGMRIDRRILANSLERHGLARLD